MLIPTQIQDWFTFGKPLPFNSVAFFVLFMLFYGLYAIAFRNVRVRNALLVVFSLFFYYKLAGWYVLLLIATATSDFFIGQAIYKAGTARGKKAWMLLSLFLNLGSLCFFKYVDFFIESWFGIVSPGTEAPLLHILAPIGISFFTFKTLSYIFDLHREMIDEPEKNYINYLLYVSFFPNLLMGPISFARDLLPQIASKLTINNEMLSKGFFLIMCGIVKKFFFANMLAEDFVNRVFDQPHLFSGFESLMASYGYMIQIYLDFSGYTDIVIGIAMLMGFTILPNFNQPFKARNITEFWRRWHMSLSKWLNEYLFLPMSFGMRKWKKTGVVIAAILTFFISGLWHSAKWTYVIWGSLHGLAIAWEAITQSLRSDVSKRTPKRLYNFISIFITFNFLSLSAIFFRADNVASAKEMFRKILTIDLSIAGLWLQNYAGVFVLMIVALALQYIPFEWDRKVELGFGKLHWSLKTVTLFVLIILIFQAVSSAPHPFLYLEY
jgi:D-alanyl-lipoteichoic acid acyltransferase DltB (MBOAT superfamily)